MNFQIAGVKFHQYKDALGTIEEGNHLTLEPEPTNKFDPNAVAIYLESDEGKVMLGYVPKKFSSEVSAKLEVGKKLECILTLFNPSASTWNMFEVEIKEIEE